VNKIQYYFPLPYTVSPLGLPALPKAVQMIVENITTVLVIVTKIICRRCLFLGYYIYHEKMFVHSENSFQLKIASLCNYV
jgi:hypothetical protein